MNITTFAILGLLFGAATMLVAGILLGRYVWPTARPGDAAALATAKAEVENLVKQVDDRTQLPREFANIAYEILLKKASELSDTSRQALSALLDPLRERIKQFEEKVDNTYGSELREVLSLKAEIKLVMEMSHSISSQADDLVKALRGESQLRGRWGELALERILEAAGLTQGRDYVVQGRGLGLKSDAGESQRPDIVVRLPEKRTIIVDSKLPLIGYERLVGCADDAERKSASLQYLRDFRLHIDDLSGKRYQENTRLRAHDCVLMFVPIEGALAAALTHDPELFTYAWDRHVVLVGPSTLLMTMRTVASIWRYEMQGENAQEIARLAGELCDKVSMSLGDLNTAAEKMNAALAAHNEAVKRLVTGRGNALFIGERIRGMGVKVRRPMPAVFVDGAEVRHVGDETVESSEADDQP
ncbi:MAG TPA: DNA recombination protein RmuC [Stellaceae bacterium]|nr:DNA recombination protein RmuC [Stellaceae bacterium]